MPHTRFRLASVRGVLLGGMTAALLAFPVGVLAGATFGDVPPSHPFHHDVEALAASGVTVGCGGGDYCPGAAVTRGQMAAFLNRLGALQPGTTPVVDADRVDGLDSSAFARPIYAVVNASGTLARGVSVSSSLKQTTGAYRVTFTRDVASCAYLATLGNVAGGFPEEGVIAVASSDTPSPNDIYVETRDLTGAPADRAFHIQIMCAAAEGAVVGSGPDASPGTDSNAD